MPTQPRILHNIVHPFIDSIYLKEEYDLKEPNKVNSILVIDAKRHFHAGTKRERHRLFLSFLADLDLLKDEVERKAGKFKRIDIRFH